MCKSYVADYKNVLPAVRRVLFPLFGITSPNPRHFGQKSASTFDNNVEQIEFIIHDNLFHQIESFLLKPGQKLTETSKVNEKTMPVIIIPSENPYPSDMKF